MKGYDMSLVFFFLLHKQTRDILKAISLLSEPSNRLRKIDTRISVIHFFHNGIVNFNGTSQFYTTKS